ncbi:putative TetR family transcriptional regulator [Gordonia hirsuta DSM 44140 = NBRC 16056]|uniref:Putative TetR family transcriptional regulator n=1 Tax=Gordonia hirsuta DSM 44140 = NBRC 16056 TaxID=1121927 RepID=L7L9P8_9ACTN|nr:TetR/AcrR family transcriptional regulator [Gordonia hirsuta]GAC56777.1 putative TetR family transcriptional regulator [Gordonia hirsuta DSM 44140 = NBRC 16056]
MTVTENAAGTPERRRRMSPEQRRQQLLDIGLAMSRDMPPEEVTMEAVAEAAGVSRGLVFHYFESTHDFHLAIMRAQAADMLERTRPPEGIDDPNEAALAAIGAYVDYVEEHPAAYASVLRGALSAEAGLREVTEATRNEVAARVISFAPALGLTVNATVRAAVMGWIAFTEDVMIRWLTERELSREQVLGLLTTSLLAVAGAAALVDV